MTNQKQYYISTSQEYDEVLNDLTDYLDKKNMTIVEKLGLLDLLRGRYLQDFYGEDDE